MLVVVGEAICVWHPSHQGRAFVLVCCLPGLVCLLRPDIKEQVKVKLGMQSKEPMRGHVSFRRESRAGQPHHVEYPPADAEVRPALP